jgi:hypothetical protein
MTDGDLQAAGGSLGFADNVLRPAAVITGAAMVTSLLASPAVALLRSTVAALLLMVVATAPLLAAAATTISWPQPSPIVYGTPISATATATSQGRPVAGTFTYSPALGTVLPVGNHRISATFAPADGGRPATRSIHVRVTSATLTVTSTATMAHGTPVPALAPTYSGFVNGDTAGSVLTGSPSLSTSATSASPVGSYPISVARGTLTANGNYTLRYVAGTLTVTPAPVTITLGGLSHTYDGTAHPATVSTTPVGVSTSVTYNGSTTVPVNAGTYTVSATATNPNYSGSATGTLVIAKAHAAVTLGGLAHTYDGGTHVATVSTEPTGLAHSVTYGGAPAEPIAAGSYAVVATITDPNYNGSATGTLTVAPAAAGVTISGLSHTYDGATHPATVTTTPAGLPVLVSYNSSTTAPVNAGSYEVIATVQDPNYTGTASDHLVIAKADATVTLADLAHTYDGTAHTAAVTTNPAGLAVAITYDGSATAPIAAGSYAVAASITDANYQGGTSGSLIIAKAAQGITMAPLANVMVGDPDQPLSATATSGLPVGFSVDGPAEVVGNALHVTGAGTITVTATQAGDGNWLGAVPVVQTITAVPETGGGLLASYFANRTLSGSPVLSRTDAQVDFDWASGSPAPGTVPSDNFSVRWDGELVPRFNEAYTLTFRTDDGVRVWFDGQLIVNHWTDRSAADSTYTFTAEAGRRYRIRMEYYENGGLAVARLLWRSASEPAGPVPKRQLHPVPPDTSGPIGTGTGLTASYFANETLAGVPTVSRVDATVDFVWAGGSPAVGVPADSFSARWTGDIQPRYTEPYTLILRTDDGVRVWLDGQLVINDWFLRSAANSSYTFNAEAGRRYRIHIEYYEHFGSAVAQLHWYSAREFSGAVPATQLYPLPVPVVQVADIAQPVAEGQPVSLSGTLSNTGNAPVALAWSQVSGPASATFHAPQSANTTAHFPVAGTYVVALSAFNGHVVVSDTASVTVTTPDLTTDLVAYYPFDEATGMQAKDHSGRFHHGAISGATREAGKQGGALRFSGTSYVYIPGNEDLDPATPALTLAAWLRPDRSLSDMTHPYPMPIYRADHASSVGYALMVTAVETDRLGLRIHHLAGSGQRLETFTSQALTPGAWVHVAGVLNDTTMTFYLNGVPVASRTTGGAQVRPAKELAMFLGRGFEGLMDEVRIYHRALDASDLAGLAQGGLDRRAPGVDAGADQVVVMPTAAFTLIGAASDDAASGRPLTASWTQLSGPAGAVIADPHSLVTSVDVASAGSYQFELSVSDGMVIGRDQVWVEVSPAAGDLTDGLLLHYKLDETSGTLVDDASIHDLNATFYGTPLWSEEGQFLGAAQFNGQSQIIAPAPNHLGALTTMTLSVWMRGDRPIVDMTHPWPTALYRADFTTNRGFGLMTTVNDTNLFGFRLHTGTGRREVSMNGVAAGAWVHVVATFDGQTMRLYRDGVLVEQNRTGAINIPAFDARLQLGIGYEGMLDDVRIYGRALSPAEVQVLHTVPPLGASG